MAGNGQQLSGERRVVTALFCDLVGSTSLAEEMDPEEWSEIVADAVRVMADSVARYGGTVTQFSGDSVLAIFGAPTAHEDDPYRAVSASLDIVRDMAGLDIECRVGINTGLMVISDMEAGAFAGYAALGDAANVAARIQGLAPPGSILIGGPTANLVRADFDLRDMGWTDVKGKSKPVHVLEVVSARGFPTRGRGLSGLRSTLVGRDAPLATLRALIDAASVGRGRFAAVVGEPGIGKSRLVRELSAYARELDATIHMGRCLSFGRDVPYHLVASLLYSLAKVPDGETAARAGEALGALSDDLLGSGHEARSILTQLVGASTGAVDAEAKYRHVQYVDALCEILARVARRAGPLVLVFEDVHWADESSVELLASVFRRLHDLPIVVLLVSRPDRAVPGWRLITDARATLGEAFTELVLQPLAETDTRQLVSNLLAVESLPEPMRVQILGKTDGNPFFVEEVVRMLIDREFVERRDGRWIARDGATQIEVPDTVRGLLAARIDLLPIDVRKAAMIASVIGRRFEARLLEAVHPPESSDADSGAEHGKGTRPSVHPHLGRLEALGFVFLTSVRPHLEFAFRHALVHDVMYQTLLKRERRGLHRAVGEAIEGVHADDLPTVSPMLADHFDRAGDDAKARDYMLMAAQLAMGRHAVREAHQFFDRALQRLSGDDEVTARRRVEAALGRFQAGFMFVPGERSVADLDSVLPDLARLDDPNLTAMHHLHRFRIGHEMGQNESDPEFRALVEESMGLMERVTNPVVQAQLKGLRGQVLRFSPSPRSSLPWFDEAATALEAHEWFAQASYQCCAAADVTAIQGMFAESQRWLERAEKDARRSGDPNAALDVGIIRGRLASERGELREAFEHVSRGMKAAGEYGNTFCELVSNFFAADQRLRLGEAEAAIPLIERTQELATYCNAGPLELLGRAWLAAARARLGEDTSEDFERAIAEARAAGDPWAEGQIRAHRANASAIQLSGAEPPAPTQSHAWEAVTRDFVLAAECLEAVGARPALARALNDHGAALQVAGREPEARQVLSRALQIFEELGIEPTPAV
jgi:class 3 adenylate cyclase/tetratricopeptide (TPR) repeat protein